MGPHLRGLVAHLYWPSLDVDLPTEVIQTPDRYKLVSK